MSEILTGGCQCGAVRFAASDLARPSVCHCRMCQKAYGGFCENCGTPLAYDTKYGLEFSIGAFDDAAKIAPIVQVNLNDKLDFYDNLTHLPIKHEVSEEWQEFLTSVYLNQYPDFETKNWPKGSVYDEPS